MIIFLLVKRNDRICEHSKAFPYKYSKPTFEKISICYEESRLLKMETRLI